VRSKKLQKMHHQNSLHHRGWNTIIDLSLISLIIIRLGYVTLHVLGIMLFFQFES
jgi:hypothetical protein